MKDLMGTPVFVGDRVIISQTGYRNLLVAVISKITEKGIKAVYRLPHRYCEEETFRMPSMFVKVPA